MGVLVVLERILGSHDRFNMILLFIAHVVLVVVVVMVLKIINSLLF